MDATQNEKQAFTLNEAISILDDKNNRKRNLGIN
jgi:hypothetical protein